MIDGRICRAARGYLNWSSRTLSAKSGVPVARIFELERDRPIGPADCRMLEAVFLRHGIAIVADGSRAIGICEAGRSAVGGADFPPARECAKTAASGKRADGGAT